MRPTIQKGFKKKSVFARRRSSSQGRFLAGILSPSAAWSLLSRTWKRRSTRTHIASFYFNPFKRSRMAENDNEYRTHSLKKLIFSFTLDIWSNEDTIFPLDRLSLAALASFLFVIRSKRHLPTAVKQPAQESVLLPGQYVSNDGIIPPRTPL